MLAKLQNDTFIFSGLRTHAQLLEASSLLLDEKGQIRNFNSFANEFNKINEKYNQHYLDAEYQFAVNSSQMAANWAALDENGRYNLQYRTANDDRVRDSHAVLHNITLPVNDEFWLYYYPPNGWRCRCNAVEVLKSKYELYDSEKAIAAGEKATTQIGPDGKNRLEIFRFNPGAEKKVFPPKHPYNKLKGAESIKKEIGNKPIENVSDLSLFFENLYKYDNITFYRGYKAIKTTNDSGVNGYTDMNGTIHLKPDIITNIISGINTIKDKNKTTYNQEKAISTLNHEIWHNTNKIGWVPITSDQRKTMELANEFVARKTLPEFMKKLGGNLENKSLTNDRDNTNYNRMVRNYDQIIEWAKCDKEKVIKTVKNHLIEGRYDDQITGLVNGIKESTEYKLKISDIKSLIKEAKYEFNSWEKFAEILDKKKELLK